MCLSKISHWLVAAVSMLSPLLCVAQEPANSSEVSYVSYISFEVPGALGTYPMSVNNSMAATGYYLDSPATARGFLRDAGGAITTFAVGNAAWTEPESINTAGDITGYYETYYGVASDEVAHGFIRYANGRMLTFDVPDVGLQGPQAAPVSINDFGLVAGSWPYPAPASSGFTRSRAGVFNTYGFGQGADYETVARGLNASGAVTGYFDQAGIRGSFLFHPDGFSVKFNVPVAGANNATLNRDTVAEGINADGTIVGWYINCQQHCVTTTTGGFIRSSQGVFTLFTPPGTLLTSPRAGYSVDSGVLSAPHLLSINREATITGSYTDAEGNQHGFVRNPYGTITYFDPPRGEKTTATSINDSGVIAGSYFYDWNTQIAQGFLRLPKP
jgi:hypothetical protein